MEQNAEEQDHDSSIDGKKWGSNGNIGVVLSHGAVYDADSWKDLGEALADEGMVAFAVEDTAPDQLTFAADMLKNEDGVDQVALIGASRRGNCH